MSEPSFSRVLIALMQGVTYAENDAPLWQSLRAYEGRARDYVAELGLELILDEAEGYAYLSQRAPEEGVEPLPRLVPRRALSYPVSLILALLRKKLAEADAGGGSTRLILGRRDIVELVRVFLPERANEARFMDRMDAHINKVAELGFLRKLRGQDDQFEVRRIIKAFVDAQWLTELADRLAEYREQAGEEP